MLNKPSITKKYKKEINKMQKSLDEHGEKQMLDWEEQFRGGHGIHGYRDGGSTIRPKPKPEPRSRMRENTKSPQPAYSQKGLPMAIDPAAPNPVISLAVVI